MTKKKTQTEIAYGGILRAKKKWFDHLAVVRKAMAKVWPDLARGGERVNARGSTISAPHYTFEVWEEERILYGYAEMNFPDPGFGSQVTTTKGYEVFVPLKLVDDQNITALARHIKKEALKAQEKKNG